MFKILVAGDQVAFNGSARATDFGKRASGANFVVYVGYRKNHPEIDDVCRRAQSNLEEMLGLTFNAHGIKSGDLVTMGKNKPFKAR